ncbi:MAG: hypothetical protein AABZ30_02825 [Myxococcota bacterium]
MIACGGANGDTGDEDRGPIEATLNMGDRVNWPGLDQASGRSIPLIRGFGNGVPIAYWFLGFASRKTADSFWFCRQSDFDAGRCPLDEHRRLNWETLQGNPIFTQIPGKSDFSPFWQMWRVVVPDNYIPNSIKTPETLNAKKEGGEVSVEPFILDFGDFFGEPAGPQEVVLHCAHVLDGTTLEENGGEMPDGSGLMLELLGRQGWFQEPGEPGAYVVNFIDFSPSDGAFPEASDSESRPFMRFANIYIHWRFCEAEPEPGICYLENYAYADRRPVSERGLGQDITGDGDPNDTNNVLGAVPCDLQRQTELPYSPLWGPQAVKVNAAMDGTVSMIDTTRDQAVSDVLSADDIFANVDDGIFAEPVEMSEDETGNPVPGNEGRVFFNCPNPVNADFVPHPCAP